MLEITVKTLDSQNHSFSCDDDITVRGFKEHITGTVNIPVESQRLIYCGRVLQDDKKLTDYGNVNGKVIHLVQRAPPQPESRSNNSDSQRQNNNQSWPQTRLQYRGHLHRNAMYLGAMSVPTEAVEGHGLPAPQLSNTLSSSRLVAARRMLNKASQLMDRMDDPSVPLHPSPTENNASEPPPQASAPEEESDQDSNVNSNVNSTRNRMVQAASEIAAAFSAAALINIRLSHDNSEDSGSITGSVNVIDTSQPEEGAQAQASESRGSQPERTEEQTSKTEKKSETAKAEATAPEPQTSEAETSEPGRSEPEKSESEKTQSTRPETRRTEPDRAEPERSDASTSNNQSQSTSRRLTPQVPRPPEMAELLDRLLSTQDRLRPYVERYRTLMSEDPTLTPGSGPDNVLENQRVVDGVSECLHYLAHANHALSDIIVDMGQQPPRNLRCRPIIIQHSAILQAGIPIQVESHINLTNRNAMNNNNSTDEGNEATRPSSPTSATSEQTNRSTGASNRPASQSGNGQASQPSLLGTLLNLPSNVELSMELSPQSAMDLSSPSAVDGSESEQSQSNNNNGNVGGASNLYSMTQPFALIRDALQNVLNEHPHLQFDTSNGSTNNTPTNIPFVTIVGQQMDIGTPNSGQSTQARSNIGTHPTTSTQTRSTARPHVLHPHSHPLNVGVGMGQSLDFDPFLPCNSHHVRRTPQGGATSTSTSQSNQSNQTTTSESHSRSASHSSSSTRQAPSMNFTVGGDANIARDLLGGDGEALAGGIGLAMTLGELLQGPATGGVHISLLGSGPNASEIHLTPNSDVPLAELLRSLNVRLEEFTGRNFLIDLWLFLLRNVSFGGLMQLSMGQSAPLVSLRRLLREFLEHSFPDSTRESLQERVVEQIVSLNRPYLQSLVVPDEETVGRRVDIPATIEALLHKFCLELLKLLFNNDLDDVTFAQEAVTLAKKLEDQSSAVLQHILQGGQTALETIASRFVNQLTEGIHPFFQQTLLGVLSSRIRAYATRTTQMSRDEITSLIVYKDEPSAPPAESDEMVMEPASEPQLKTESQEPVAQAQANQSVQQPIQPTKPETVQDKPIEIKPEPMETDAVEEKKVDDLVDLAIGEEIPETFPGAEHLPPEWVPIIARDSVRIRKQQQLEALQGGPIPFSDAYLSCMPSKRRKLIEQQKPQLLASPTPNSTAITASVERLVREGIAHTPVEEVEGAARAVANSAGVRNAFGQAIKECLHPARLKTPDFPNSARYPNATKILGDKDNEKESPTKPTTAPLLKKNK